MKSVPVSLGDRSYEILVEPGLIREVGMRVKNAGLTGRCAIISDHNVAGPYLNGVQRALEISGYETTSHVFPAGESSKSMSETTSLCRSLIEDGHDRSSFIIALGGGVVGDLAGFIASIFYRGIPFVQIPTTIVSQVDSAVGGKTGVNTPEGKNLIGCFHQPRLVIIDPETLLTLPSREFREGFAEVIKHAAIRDIDMMAELENIDPDNQVVSATLIAQNVAIKAAIVEEDEEEQSGTRALLNFGHTIGHAIEAAVPYGTYLHGEAISLGIRAALKLSEDYAGLTIEESERVLDILETFRLPLLLTEDIETDAILEKLDRDKKFFRGKRTFVLLDRIGNAITNDEVPPEAVRAAIEYLRS